jgi:hypothetical protein
LVEGCSTLCQGETQSAAPGEPSKDVVVAETAEAMAMETTDHEVGTRALTTDTPAAEGGAGNKKKQNE